MIRLTPRSALPVLAAAALTLAACHRSAPVTTVSAPTPAQPTDDGAAARARAEAAARDSIARAETARREAAARAEADRRSREANGARASLLAKLYFDFDRDDLLADAKATLEQKIPVMMSRRQLRIRIEGNTDERGSDTYNLALGQRRAAAAKTYLVARGIDESRIDVVSFGEDRPTCKESEETCWRQNRRDEFVIVAGAEALAVPEAR
jgi:peptidoglycan-associated lipoprotein